MKSISKFVWGLEAYIIFFLSSVDPCILISKGRPGDTFAVAGDRAI